MLCPIEKVISSIDQKVEDINMSLCFQVADVKKPLISVKRIVENGNNVGFGPGEGDNFILNDNSGIKCC